MRRNFAKAARSTATLGAIVASILFAANVQAGVTPDGSEYPIAAPLEGDQLHPDLALGPNGGFLVWDDNKGDGDGLSVNMRRITATLNGDLNVIGLATKTAGHQERPRVTMLTGGGAAFVWQSGPDGAQKVMTRVLTSANVFSGEEVAVSVRSELNQMTPAIAGLTTGNYVVVWSSFGQDGSMQGVFAAVFSPTAQKIAGEFQVNGFSAFNQRNPAVTALPGGGFVVTWISEGNRGDSSADVYARIYDANANYLGNEFRVNSSDRVCSSPSVATTSTGNFTITWCEIAQDLNFEANSGNDGLLVSPLNSPEFWDIYVSGFTPAGARITEPARLNQKLAGNQRNPRIAAIGRSQLVVWQDGDQKMIMGRAVNGIGAPDGNEFTVNTNLIGHQLMPTVAGNGDSRFVVCWSAYNGLATQVDLRAQRFVVEQGAVELPPAGAPYVSALSQSRLSVTWPAADGYDVQNYELYLNGSATPIIVNGQVNVVSGLAPGTTYQFEVAYRLRDGQLSPRSAPVSGKTWGEDWNDDGLPDDWQAKYWGNASFNWPAPGADSDGDGVSNRQEYMAGTDPTDATSALRTSFSMTSQGPRLVWNTVPGQIYQVEQTSDFSSWVPFGGLRFAPGTSDSVSIPVGNSLGYYRVNRIR